VGEARGVLCDSPNFSPMFPIFSLTDADLDIDSGPASTRFELSLPDEESLRIKTSLSVSST
jgi:hypothetical protein